MCAGLTDSIADDIQRAVRTCVDTMSADAGIPEPTSVALLSVLMEAKARYSDQDRIPRALVRALVGVYPALADAADKSGASSVRSFIEQIVRIDMATVDVTLPGTQEYHLGDLSELVNRLSDAAGDVYVPVRMLDGVDDHAVRIFQDTLAEVGAVIGHSESIPRPIADVLVSTFSAVDFQRRSEYYSPAESQVIAAAARAILESIREWIR